MKNLSKREEFLIKHLAGIAKPCSWVISHLVTQAANARIENGRYWNYFNTPDLEAVLEVLTRTQVKHLAELGSGFPIIPECLKIINPKAQFTCFEIQKKIVDISKRHFSAKIQEKNILDLIGKDFAPYSHFFYWKPIANDELLKTLVERMIMWTKKGQIIVLYGDHVSLPLLEKSKLFEMVLRVRGIYAFKKVAN